MSEYTAYMGVDQDDKFVLVKAEIEEGILALRVTSPGLHALNSIELGSKDLIELVKLYVRIMDAAEIDKLKSILRGEWDERQSS